MRDAYVADEEDKSVLIQSGKEGLCSYKNRHMHTSSISSARLSIYNVSSLLFLFIYFISLYFFMMMGGCLSVKVMHSAGRSEEVYLEKPDLF